MSEYIVCEGIGSTVTDHLGVKHTVNHYEKREDIVRCRDCRYLCDDGSTWGCGWHCSCLTTNDGTPPDGFCAWGEREVDG